MSSFHERQKSLFEQLKTAEDQYSFSKTNKATAQDFGTIDRQRYRKVKHEMKQFRGRESIYKRGEANIRECLRAKTIPDYMKNPQKWVYYSLADVTPEQMSDRANRATALAFMQEMEEKESEKNSDTEVIEDTGAVFKKPTFKISKTVKPIENTENSTEDNKAVFKSNKIIMPEYVVGASRKKNKAQTTKVRTSKNENESKNVSLVLNHLFEDNESEEET